MSDTAPSPEDSPAARRGRRHWFSPGPTPQLPGIGAKRAYAEVLFVFGAFFATGVIAAALILANRTGDVQQNGSWGIYMAQSVATVFQIGLAGVLVWLLCDRRGVTLADLGISTPRLDDGRLAVSRTVRIAAWAFAAEYVGGIVNHVLQSGHLPTQQNNAPEIIFSMFDSLQAGFIEELVVLAFVVVTLRQAGRPLWEVTVVALVLRGSYHIYYGPGVFGILLWAALYYWIYLRTRSLVTLMVCHTLWDMVAFLGTYKAVAVVAFLAMVGLWLTAPILWLVERSNRNVASVVWATQAEWNRQQAWPPQQAWPSQHPWPPQHSWPPQATGSPQQAGPSQPETAPRAADWPAQPVRAGAGGPTAPVAPVAAPPGWHPDPGGQNRWRWWDGGRWTEHLSEHPKPSSASNDPPPPGA